MLLGTRNKVMYRGYINVPIALSAFRDKNKVIFQAKDEINVPIALGAFRDKKIILYCIVLYAYHL